MRLIEWSYGNGPIRSKVCPDEFTLTFWLGFATSSGASFIIISEVGQC